MAASSSRSPAGGRSGKKPGVNRTGLLSKYDGSHASVTKNDKLGRAIGDRVLPGQDTRRAKTGKTGPLIGENHNALERIADFFRPLQPEADAVPAKREFAQAVAFPRRRVAPDVLAQLRNGTVDVVHTEPVGFHHSNPLDMWPRLVGRFGDAQ